ncbi:xanthine dehydrogenase family protein subunit M, partial [Chloroflexota bacterium]
KALEDSLIREVARVASENTRPPSDVRSSADYRKEICVVLVKHGLEQAFERAKMGVR